MIEYDSKDIDDNNWYIVKDFATPHFLVMMEHINLDIVWKGNFDAGMKLGLVRNGVEVTSCEPFMQPTEHYTERVSRV
jgi:hypothetical protein